MKRFALAVSVIAALGLCSVALAASTLSGTYKTKITSSALGGQLKGTWTIKFKSGGYTVAANGKVVILGKFSIKGSEITLKDKSGPDKCPAPGTYKFKLKGKTLKFTKVSDSNPSCAGRPIVLKGTFTKVG
jgi:hypothetical protein